MFAGAGNVASGVAEKLNFSWPWNESSLTTRFKEPGLSLSQKMEEHPLRSP